MKQIQKKSVKKPNDLFLFNKRIKFVNPIYHLFHNRSNRVTTALWFRNTFTVPCQNWSFRHVLWPVARHESSVVIEYTHIHIHTRRSSSVALHFLISDTTTREIRKARGSCVTRPGPVRDASVSGNRLKNRFSLLPNARSFLYFVLWGKKYGVVEMFLTEKILSF